MYSGYILIYTADSGLNFKNSCLYPYSHNIRNAEITGSELEELNAYNFNNRSLAIGELIEIGNGLNAADIKLECNGKPGIYMSPVPPEKLNGRRNNGLHLIEFSPIRRDCVFGMFYEWKQAKMEPHLVLYTEEHC